MTLRAIFVNAVFLARFPFDHGARSRSRAPWLAVIVYVALSRQTESGSNSKQNKALSRRSFPCETTTFTKNNFTEREYVKKSKFQWKKLQQQARNNLIKPRHTHTHVTVPCPACDKSWAAGRVPRVRSWLRVPPASFSAALPACSGPAMSSWRRAPSCGACALLRCRASLAARDCWGRGARRRWWGGPPASLRRLTLFRKRFNFFFLRSLVLYKLTRDRTAQPGRVVTVSSGSRVRISPAPVYYYMTFLSALCNAQLRRRLRCEAAIVKSSRNSKLLTRSWRPRSLRSRANRKKNAIQIVKTGWCPADGRWFSTDRPWYGKKRRAHAMTQSRRQRQSNASCSTTTRSPSESSLGWNDRSARGMYHLHSYESFEWKTLKMNRS